MNRRTLCNGAQHLVIEDVPGPNDTVDTTMIVDARPCDCAERPIPWDQPGADPLGDIRAYVRDGYEQLPGGSQHP